MPHSQLSTVTHIFGQFIFSLSIWSCISLFVLIEKRSRKEIGSYKNFLRLYCIYAFCYATIDWLVQPGIIVDSEGLGYVFYSENRLFDLGYGFSQTLQILFCGCFIASTSFLSLNFIYRYVTTCRKHAVKYFHGWWLLCWFLYCSVPFVIWSLCVYQWMGPTAARTVHLTNQTLQFEDVDLTDRPYVAPLCRHVRNEPGHEYRDINWPTFGALFGLCGFQTLFYAISLICGTLIYRENMVLFKAAQLSPHLYKLQIQLLRAIVLQAVIPLISIYVPAGIIIAGSMAGVYVGRVFGNLTVMMINIYPPLDTIVFLLSIRDYREALFCVKSTVYPLSGNNSIQPLGFQLPKISEVSLRAAPADA